MNKHSRPSCSQLDSILGETFKVLDHGFIIVRDYMGDDKAIEDAARISYGEGTRKVSDRRALLRYLMRNKHTSPFEMCEIKLHVKMPIFVARQWIRHRTANVNEYSARYSVLSNEFYIPATEDIQFQSESNKQGRAGVVEGQQALQVQEMLRKESLSSYDTYEELLDQGLARELARIGLTLNSYTEMVWKIDLHNLLHFLKLRVHPHAQYEIRAYAETLLSICSQWVPLTVEAFEDYVLGAVTYSRAEMELLRSLTTNVPLDHVQSLVEEHPDLSKREKAAFIKSLSDTTD